MSYLSHAGRRREAVRAMAGNILNKLQSGGEIDLNAILRTEFFQPIRNGTGTRFRRYGDGRDSLALLWRQIVFHDGPMGEADLMDVEFVADLTAAYELAYRRFGNSSRFKTLQRRRGL